MISTNFLRGLFFVLFAVMLTLSEAQAKRKPKPSPVDHMALATMMIYDGKYEKALAELNEVDMQKEDFDLAKYESMQGIVALKLQKYQKAIEHFDQAIEAVKVKVYKAPPQKKEKWTLYKFIKKQFKGEEKKTEKPSFDPKKRRAEQLSKLYLYKSEAYYKLKAYDKVIESLNMAGEAGRKSAKMYRLRADCYWKMKQHDKAIEMLNEGFAKFPKSTELIKQKFYYLVDLGLFQHASYVSKEYFKVIVPEAKDYILFAQTLERGGELDEAIKLLEGAMLRYPKEAKLGILLGHYYLKRDMKHVTADIFEKSSYYDHNYTKEAAEMHRRANDIPHAIYLNAQINDEAEKIKQKIAIFIQRGEFEKVIGLKNALYRYNLLSDENLRYALAYAYFMVKDYDKAEFHLKKLTRSDLFSKATLIRKNIEKCKNSSLECI